MRLQDFKALYFYFAQTIAKAVSLSFNLLKERQITTPDKTY